MQLVTVSFCFVIGCVIIQRAAYAKFVGTSDHEQLKQQTRAYYAKKNIPANEISLQNSISPDYGPDQIYIYISISLYITKIV